MKFLGYKREDGKFGVRNHMVVMSSVCCANSVVEAIGRVLPEVVTVTQAYGCGYVTEDFNVSRRVLAGLINNPNVGAVLIIGLGCELLKSEYLAQSAQGKPAEALEIQKNGGSAATTEKGIEIATKFLKELKARERMPAPVSELVIGLECGASDSFSGCLSMVASHQSRALLLWIPPVTTSIRWPVWQQEEHR